MTLTLFPTAQCGICHFHYFFTGNRCKDLTLMSETGMIVCKECRAFYYCWVQPQLLDCAISGPDDGGRIFHEMPLTWQIFQHLTRG